MFVLIMTFMYIKCIKWNIKDNFQSIYIFSAVLTKLAVFLINWMDNHESNAYKPILTCSYFLFLSIHLTFCLSVFLFISIYLYLHNMNVYLVFSVFCSSCSIRTFFILDPRISSPIYYNNYNYWYWLMNYLLISQYIKCKMSYNRQYHYFVDIIWNIATARQ